MKLDGGKLIAELPFKTAFDFYCEDSYSYYRLARCQLTMRRDSYDQFNSEIADFYDNLDALIESAPELPRVTNAYLMPVYSGSWVADTTSPHYNRGDVIMALCAMENRILIGAYQSNNIQTSIILLYKEPTLRSPGWALTENMSIYLWETPENTEGVR